MCLMCEHITLLELIYQRESSRQREREKRGRWKKEPVENEAVCMRGA